ncbi:MAG: lipocalin family protein [Candidatus Promineifilaceae bacterium]|nr:lipocalin family protein [Candidatus Promineifilaceae bacterium]
MTTNERETVRFRMESIPKGAQDYQDFEERLRRSKPVTEPLSKSFKSRLYSDVLASAAAQPGRSRFKIHAPRLAFAGVVIILLLIVVGKSPAGSTIARQIFQFTPFNITDGPTTAESAIASPPQDVVTPNVLGAGLSAAQTIAEFPIFYPRYWPEAYRSAEPPIVTLVANVQGSLAQIETMRFHSKSEAELYFSQSPYDPDADQEPFDLDIGEARAEAVMIGTQGGLWLENYETVDFSSLDLPAGAARLVIGVYDAGTSQRLAVDGDPAGELELAAVTVQVANRDEISLFVEEAALTEALSLRYHALLALGVALLLFCTACGGEVGSQKDSAAAIVGRWKLIENDGVTVPHSFFWFSMDFIEIRADGMMLGLMKWPPEDGVELRLNKTAEYTWTIDGRLQISGSCRYQDPCTGLYDPVWQNDHLRLEMGNAFLEMRRTGPVIEATILPIPGPSPSATPDS